MAVKMEVWGNFACFSRPEMKVERVSYDVMTPSAARGMLEAVYWHPGLQWHIDNIYVLAPIQMTNIRRNEVQSKVLGSSVRAAMTGGRTELYINTSKDIVQRASLVLQDVRYVIEAHFTLTEKAAAGDNPGQGQISGYHKAPPEKGTVLSRTIFWMSGIPGEFQGVGGRRDSGYSGDKGSRLYVVGS